MLVECNNCGAPLNVQESARSVRCNYCQRDNRIRSLRTLALQTPMSWSPPAVWTPPSHFTAPPQPLTFNRSANSFAKGLIWFIVITTLVSTVLPLLFFAVIFIVAIFAGVS